MSVDRDFDYVVCSKCGSEFQPHVTHCIDCGAATAPPRATIPSPAKPKLLLLTSDSGDVSVRTANLDWIESLQELFEEHGIDSRVQPVEGSQDQYEVLVAPEDAKRAFVLDRELLQERLDDGTELSEIPPPGVCPYCRTEVDESCVECPRCGLVIAW